MQEKLGIAALALSMPLLACPIVVVFPGGIAGIVRWVVDLAEKLAQ